MRFSILISIFAVICATSANASQSERSWQVRLQSYEAKKLGVNFVEEEAVSKAFYPSYLTTKGGSLITQSDFNALLARLQDLYQPTVTMLGKKLEIIGDWEDATVNAQATRDQDSWRIHVAGGIARAPKMDKDALLIIVCHEIGHQIGGAPRMALFGNWPSAEGQADYWASSKCLKRYFQRYRHEGEVLSLPEKVRNQCLSQYMQTEEREICLKSISAAVKFGRFLDTLNPKKPAISFDTPDQRQVRGTNINDYPRPQCRFDTLYAGALCSISAQELNSPDDELAGNCNDQNRLGARPRCWFKP